MTNEEAIQKYQCPGCVLGPFPTCYDTKIDGIGCSNHCVGKLFLGGIDCIEITTKDMENMD